MTSWISATPNPAQVGDTVTVCYDFNGSRETGEVVLSVTLDGPDGKPMGGQSLVVSPYQPCATFVVPTGCTSILIEDMTGTSGDLVVTVVP